jgi:hypothetical protein
MRTISISFVVLFIQSKTFSVDPIIETLLAKDTELKEKDIFGMCARARSLFLAQNSLVEMDAPVKICGKIVPVYGPGSASGR